MNLSFLLKRLKLKEFYILSTTPNPFLKELAIFQKEIGGGYGGT